ncbi:hypothetical protein MRX96_047749 [Rhipicephalus microplus]
MSRSSSHVLQLQWQKTLRNCLRKQAESQRSGFASCFVYREHRRREVRSRSVDVHDVRFKVDTGAAVMVVPKKFLRVAKNLRKPDQVLTRPVDDGLPRLSSSRVAVATWWLAMLVFSNMFSGKLKAGLTVRHKSGHRIDSATELAAREDVRVYMLRGPAYPLLLALSPNMHDKQVYRKLKLGSLIPYHRLWSDHVLDQVVAGKAVIIGDRTTLLYHASEVCHRYRTTSSKWTRNAFSRTRWSSTTTGKTCDSS